MPRMEDILKMKARHLRRDMAPMRVVYQMGFTNKAFQKIDVQFGEKIEEKMEDVGGVPSESSEFELDPGHVSKIESLQRLYLNKGKVEFGYYRITFLDKQNEELGKLESHPFEKFLDEQNDESLYQK